MAFAGLLLWSCEPENPARTQPNIKVRASVTHPCGVLRLGDTLAIDVQLPDTLKGYTPNGDFKTEYIRSLQSAWFGLYLYRVDMVHKKVYLSEGSKLTAWNSTSQKAPEPDCFMMLPKLQTTSRPFNTTIYIVPQVKGLYYLQVVSQAGNCLANKKFNFGLVVGFDIPDDHLDLVAPYLGGQQFYDAIYHTQMEGFGYFAFLVE